MEEYAMKGRIIKHHEHITMYISSSHCLGATEGWFSIQDEEKGVVFVARKDTLSPVPMIHYQETADRYFLRAYNSIGEADDTTKSTWAGRYRQRFSYIAYREDIHKARNAALRINGGLLARWRTY